MPSTDPNVTPEGAMIFELGPESRALIERQTKAIETLANAMTRVPVPAKEPATFRKPSSAPSGNLPTTLPNYGRSKGAPIAGASKSDLDFYANGCRKSLNDEGKARFHDSERRMLAAIEAEIARQSGANGNGYGDPPPGFPGPPEPPPGDDDIPF